MRSTLPMVLAVLLAAGAIVYALMQVTADIRHVSDDLDTVARDIGAMSEDVRSIADDVNAIADALSEDSDEDDQEQSTGVARRVHAPRARRPRAAMRGRAHPRIVTAASHR